MKIFEKIKKHTIFILIVLIYALPIGLIFVMDYMQDRSEIDELKDVIKTKNDVSVDYRQGWMDCIDHLVYMRTRATNSTSGV